MSWFKKKQDQEKELIAKKATIEIVAAKDATNKATEEAQKNAEQLKDLLERNHFSVTLYIAVGGTPPRTQKRKNA